MELNSLSDALTAKDYMGTVGFKASMTVVILVSMALSPLSVGHHHGRILLMGKWVLIFDDRRILLNAGMKAGDFFDQLERREGVDGELFLLRSKPVIHYPQSLEVDVFGSPWELGDTPFDVPYSGSAALLMGSLRFRAEWKTGLTIRPVSGVTVRQLKKNEMAPNVLWGYELAVTSENVPLTDHLVVSVYDRDSTLIARFSGAP